MAAYLGRRIIGFVGTLLLISIAVFAFLNLIPGDPAQIVLGIDADPTVYEATRLSGGGAAGRVVNTGTLEVDTRGVRYRRNPTDRLVLNLDDQRHEFVIEEA